MFAVDRTIDDAIGTACGSLVYGYSGNSVQPTSTAPCQSVIHSADIHEPDRVGPQGARLPSVSVIVRRTSARHLANANNRPVAKLQRLVTAPPFIAIANLGCLERDDDSGTSPASTLPSASSDIRQVVALHRATFIPYESSEFFTLIGANARRVRHHAKS